MSTCDKLTGTLTVGATMSGGLLVAKGEKGDKGDKGDAYVITDADKQQIKEALSADISELKSDLKDKIGWAKVTGSTLYLYADKAMTNLIQTVTLPSSGSGGGSADGNTTYTFAISGNVITVTDSDGGRQTITLPSAVTDSHINSLIDAKLGVIENGTY